LDEQEVEFRAFFEDERRKMIQEYRENPWKTSYGSRVNSSTSG